MHEAPKPPLTLPLVLPDGAPNVGGGGPKPPNGRPSAPPTIATSPHTERITTKPMILQKMNLLPVARSVSLSDRQMKYLKTPQKKVMRAKAIKTGTKMPLIRLMMPLEYGVR